MATPSQKPVVKRPPRTKLNMRERRFVKGLAAGLTPTTAMREAGYSKSMANVKSGEKVREPLIAKTIQELMEARGLTKEKLLSKLDEGLESTKVISANVVSQDGEGMADAHGTTKDFIDVPDFPTRHKYLETGLKLGAHYPKEKIELSGDVAITITRKVIKVGAN